MRKQLQRLLLLCSLCCSMIFSFAQEREITGIVKDANGVPLSDVSFVNKGTKTGGVTDQAGHFKIKIPQGATLVFSSVGYSSKEVKVGSQSILSIELVSSEGELNEVVVTAWVLKESAGLLDTQ